MKLVVNQYQKYNNLHSTLIKYKGLEKDERGYSDKIHLHSTLIKYKVIDEIEAFENHDNYIYIPLWLNIKFEFIEKTQNQFEAFTFHSD